jgi:hypothetical protein
MTIFTGKHVETTGVILTVAAAFLLGLGHMVAVLFCVGVYLLDRFRPQTFKFLEKFAEPDTWPGYVALGVAALFAAHHGGWRADIVVAGIFATGDGRLFDLLY